MGWGGLGGPSLLPQLVSLATSPSFPFFSSGRAADPGAGATGGLGKGGPQHPKTPKFLERE